MSYGNKTNSRRFARLFISNISSKTAPEELQDILQAVGKLLAYDVEGRQGYIEYENSRDATEAVRRFNNLVLHGRKLDLEYAVKSTNSFIQRRRFQQERERDEGRCYICKQRGHIAKHCNENQGGGGRRRSRSRNRNRSSSSESGGGRRNNVSRSRSKSNRKSKRRNHHSSSQEQKSRNSSRSRSKSKNRKNNGKDKESKKKKQASSSRSSSQQQG